MQVELQALTEHVTDGKAITQTLEQRVVGLERDRLAQTDNTVALQLQLEDLKDRTCRNNVQLRGIPEAMDQENLQDMVKSIFQKTEDTTPLNLELDRVHRKGEGEEGRGEFFTVFIFFVFFPSLSFLGGVVERHMSTHGYTDVHNHINFFTRVSCYSQDIGI